MTSRDLRGVKRDNFRFDLHTRELRYVPAHLQRDEDIALDGVKQVGSRFLLGIALGVEPDDARHTGGDSAIFELILGAGYGCLEIVGQREQLKFHWVGWVSDDETPQRSFTF